MPLGTARAVVRSHVFKTMLQTNFIKNMLWFKNFIKFYFPLSYLTKPKTKEVTFQVKIKLNQNIYNPDRKLTYSLSENFGGVH